MTVKEGKFQQGNGNYKEGPNDNSRTKKNI